LNCECEKKIFVGLPLLGWGGVELFIDGLVLLSQHVKFHDWVQQFLHKNGSV